MSKIKKGDKVKIMLGKDRGKEGVVEYVLASKQRVFVGGANMYKRHIRKMPASRGEQGIGGGIIDIPKSLDVSNVVLVCPGCNKLTRVGYKTAENKKVRICKKCGKEIDKK